VIGIRECEAAQVAWFRAKAVANGRAWSDEGHDWFWIPEDRHVHLLFPSSLDAAAVARGVTEARRLGATVGVWLRPETDAQVLADAGFEHGWQPWWMVAELASVPATRDPRVMVDTETPDRWTAVARADGKSFGVATAHLGSPDVAGIFDMGVYPKWQRQGVGSALLSAVCTAAADAGATHAALNATPEGERLYSRRGFRRVGDGETWWLHAR
jgi:GNAT superfamily N-acetyltransferase